MNTGILGVRKLNLRASLPSESSASSIFFEMFTMASRMKGVSFIISRLRIRPLKVLSRAIFENVIISFRRV